MNSSSNIHELESNQWAENIRFRHGLARMYATSFAECEQTFRVAGERLPAANGESKIQKERRQRECGPGEFVTNCTPFCVIYWYWIWRNVRLRHFDFRPLSYRRSFFSFHFTSLLFGWYAVIGWLFVEWMKRNLGEMLLGKTNVANNCKFPEKKYVVSIGMKMKFRMAIVVDSDGP